MSTMPTHDRNSPGASAKRRPTMADVATRAGVSRTLVSFILDGKPGASEDTRRRVLAVADELGYRPDSAAQLLARGRSRTLGVLMDVRQLHEAEMVAVMAEVLCKAGMEDADDETYTGFAQQMKKSARNIVDAVKLKNDEAARKAVGEINKACSNCHEDYRG